jgi:hypothetical protein
MARPDQWIAIVWCPDCNGQDPEGCFDGDVERLGPFPTREEAERDGNLLARQGGIWLYEVERA